MTQLHVDIEPEPGKISICIRTAITIDQLFNVREFQSLRGVKLVDLQICPGEYAGIVRIAYGHRNPDLLIP